MKTGAMGSAALAWSASLGSWPTNAAAAMAARSPLRLAFNPADRAAAILLDGHAAAPSLSAFSSGPGAVRSSLARMAGSGWVAFEAEVVQATGTWAIGLANAAYPLDGVAGIGSDDNAIGFYVSTREGQQLPQSVYFDRARITAGVAPSPDGSVVSCIVDFTTRRIWFSTPEMRAGGVRWNNDPFADPIWATGGISFARMRGPYYVVFNASEAGSEVRLNGGAAAFGEFLADYVRYYPYIRPWSLAPMHYADAPGIDDGFMKRPFQLGAQWLRQGPAIESLRQRGTAINPAANYGQPIYLSDADGQWVTFADTSNGNSFQMHVPLGAMPAAGNDRHMTFFDLSRAPFMACLFQAVIENPGPDGGVSAQTTRISCTDLQVDNAYANVAADRLTGQPGKNAGLGVIRNWHLAQAIADPGFVIPHMLRWSGGVSQMYWDPAWATDDTTQVGPSGLPSIMWPLNLVDGHAPRVYSGHCPAGATIGIPADTPRPAGKSRGFYLLFDTFQQFGAVWEDTGSNTGITLSAERIGPEYAPLLLDMVGQLDEVVQYLCILSNQTGPASMKGGPGGANAFPAPLPLDTQSYGGPLSGGWLPGGLARGF